MYPYHSPDMYKDFLGMLIPVLIVFAIVLAIGFLLRAIIKGRRERSTAREEGTGGSAIAHYMALGFAELLKLVVFLFIGIFRVIGFIFRKIFQLISSLFARRSAGGS